MSDWSHYTTRMPKLVTNLEAEMTLHLWLKSRETCLDMIERLKQVIACSYEMEREETEKKYARMGYTVFRLNDHDAVAKAGICPYCGGKEGEHADICAMWAAA